MTLPLLFQLVTNASFLNNQIYFFFMITSQSSVEIIHHTFKGFLIIISWFQFEVGYNESMLLFFEDDMKVFLLSLKDG